MLLFTSIFSSLPARGAHAEEPDAPHDETSQSIASVIESIRASERRLLNLHLSDVQVSVYEQKDQDWIESPNGIRGSVWMNGQAHTKIRVEVTGEVAPWIDGPADFGFSSYASAWDGQVGATADHAAGPNDEPHPVRRGTIQGDRPGSLSSYYVKLLSGMPWNINHYDEPDNNGSLADALTQLQDDSRIVLRTEYIRHEQQDLILIEAKRGDFRQTWHLDPTRGYALLSMTLERRTDEGQKVLDRIEVLNLQEAAEGVWFPVEAYQEKFQESPPLRIVFRAGHVQANQPWTDEIYRITFPPGYHVRDLRTGLEFQMGGTIDDLESALDATIHTATQLGAIGTEVNQPVDPAPTAQTSTNKFATPSHAGETQTVRENHTWLYVVLAATVVCLLAVAFVILPRRRSKTPGAPA
jgi:hypothetical protein